jgi:hypothetical protein
VKTSIFLPLTAGPGGAIFTSTLGSIFRSLALGSLAVGDAIGASDLAESEALSGDFAGSDEAVVGLEGYVTRQPLYT